VHRGKILKLQVIADTSFLMIPGLFGVDIISELERLIERHYVLVIPKPVAEELKQLAAHGKPAERSAARLGLALLTRGEMADVRGAADNAILKLAGGGNCVVGTTDAALRKELRQRRVPVIYLRQKSHLAINGQLRGSQI
jgi:hypothetical protein